MDDDFPGAKFYDSYESVTLICRWPGCQWQHHSYWDEEMAVPFVEHFQAAHAVEFAQAPDTEARW